MSLAVIIITGIAVLIILLLFVPLGIGLKYENGAFLIFKIAFFSFDIPFEKKLMKKKKRGSKSKANEKSESKPEEALNSGIMGVDFLLDVFGASRAYVRRHMSLEGFELKIILGASDAAITAIGAGSLWALSYNLLGLIDKLLWVKEPRIDIKPVFNQTAFEVSCKGIIATRMAHIIAVALIFAYKYLKYKKQNKEDK